MKPVFLIAVIGILLFLAITYFGDFKSSSLSVDYAKHKSHASEDHNASGHGLIGRSFKTKDFSGESTSRLDETINFNFDEEGSIRWMGLIIPERGEKYKIYAKTNQGVRVYINNQVVIDQINNNGMNEFSGEVTFEALKGYPIVVEYSGAKGNLEISWSSSSTPKQTIPKENLFDGSDVSIKTS